MHLLYQKISEKWPFVALGLILLGLWATLLIQSSVAQPAGPQAKQLSYGLALPNIMAPVIRKEVHKESSPDDERFACSSIRLPGLWELFSFQK